MRRAKGFTLVELSIVLVLLALLVGGVMAGRSLVQASSLRAMMRDAENYGKAIAIFREKYLELPGDYTAATTQWGTDSHGCPKVYWANEIYKATCNGNGNGLIDGASGSSSEERWRAWQHLGNAGLIDQALSGGQGSGNNAQIGYNIPQSSKEGIGFSMIQASPANTPNDPPQVILQLGAVNGKLTDGGALTPADARTIDQKADDGNPSNGTVQSASAASPGTCQVSSSGVASYNVTSIGNLCALHFLTGLR